MEPNKIYGAVTKKYLVTKAPPNEGLIIETVEIEVIGGMPETIGIHTMDTKRKDVRAALIELGWTPPTGNPGVEK